MASFSLLGLAFGFAFGGNVRDGFRLAGFITYPLFEVTPARKKRQPRNHLRQLRPGNMRQSPLSMKECHSRLNRTKAHAIFFLRTCVCETGCLEKCAPSSLDLDSKSTTGPCLSRLNFMQPRRAKRLSTNSSIG